MTTATAATATATHDSPLSYALNLGWRIAYLYALADDFDPPLDDTLLPLHHSLAPDDQLELQVLAAVGDARRAEIPACAEALDALVPLARAAAGSVEHCEEFRQQVRACHIAVDKELWARREADGKAYELGNGLSDTYNRICRAYRDPAIDMEREWQEVFDPQRIERLKTHLHDLQSRLDARAVTVVSDHLNAWRARVATMRETPGFKAPSRDDTRVFLRRQTTIWRQLLAGDKQPEGYLGREERARVRGELGKMVWRRYLPWFPAVVLAVAGLVTLAANLGNVTDWYQNNSAAKGMLTLGVSLAGALGITHASVGLTVRTRLREWTELLWGRALAKRVTAVTLLVDELLPDPTRSRLVEATVHVGHGAGARASALREHIGRARGTPSREA